MDRPRSGTLRIGERCRFARRKLLALTGSALTGTVAGCSALEPSAGDPNPKTGENESDDSSGFNASFLSESVSSHIAATDGFADASWLSGIAPDVLTVTTLEGSGEGSFRWAIDQRGPRTVVFEARGVVDLEGESLEVDRPGLYVAGQTAPSPGITLGADSASTPTT